MRGSVAYQVHQIFETVKEIGTSKHEAKEKARANGAATWHQIGKEIGVKSYATLDTYRDVCKDFFKFAKEELNVKDIEKVSGTDVKAFLESKIDTGVAHATLSKYAAALEKLEVGLNRFAENNGTGREYDFSKGLTEARFAGKKLEKFKGTRAYRNPSSLVASVRGDKFNLVASLQKEGGARVKETNHLTKTNLKGIHPDKQTGQAKGWIKVQGKGGKIREIGVKPSTYSRLEKAVANGRFEFKTEAYRNELKKAASMTHQKYEGSHGLRWSWAQNRHQELQQKGLTYEQTLRQVSVEMGHERADITEHYLR